MKIVSDVGVQSTRPKTHSPQPDTTGSPQYRLAPVVLPVSGTLPTRPNTDSPHHSYQGQGVSYSCNSAAVLRYES